MADLKRTENSLRQTERKFRAIFDNTSDGIFLHDMEGWNLVMCNKSCLQMFGYTEEEFLKLSVADLHSEEDLPFIYAQIEKVLTGGKPVRNDIRFKRKDGSFFFADVSPDLVLLDGRQYMVIAMKDITERKRMEEELRGYAERLEELVEERTSALRESETKYRGLYHTIADGVFVMEADGRIGDANDSACAQLGYAREELIGMPISAVSARPDFNLGEIFDRLRTAGSFSYETAHRRKDGAIIPVELSVALVEFRGRPAVLGVARDISERKRAEDALRFTQFAVDHMADAAFWMTQDARFCYVNEAACRALGYSRDELLRMTLYDIDPAFTESMWSESWRDLRTRKSRIFETVHRARDGRIYPVEIHANYLQFGGREYHCAFARDITERKQAEEALRRLNEHLESLVSKRTEDLTHMVARLRQLTWEVSQAEDRERKRIADLLHDDVQQTLAAARFHLNLLSTQPRSVEDSREIICQVRQMLKDAIEKARNLSHELSPALYQVDLAEILNWLGDHMQHKHGLIVHVEVQGQVEPSAEPLKALLYKMARELLFNVVKHAGVREATVRVRRMGRYICLSVTDRGRGFDPRDIERATGFGLLSIRERVRLLGGRVKIKSVPGMGSRFRIVVPDRGPLQTVEDDRSGDTEGV
ncbi:MAG: PAS domain S-box protein [Solirubrobacterales bacterium]